MNDPSGQADLSRQATTSIRFDPPLKNAPEIAPSCGDCMVQSSLPTDFLPGECHGLWLFRGFAHFRNQAQLVSYAGYDVVKRQSGKSIHRAERISKKGNHHLRKALFFPSIIAPKQIPAFGRLYQRINQKNANTKMKGAVALQRKLLVLAFQLVKQQQYYDPLKGK